MPIPVESLLGSETFTTTRIRLNSMLIVSPAHLLVSRAGSVLYKLHTLFLIDWMCDSFVPIDSD